MSLTLNAIHRPGQTRFRGKKILTSGAFRIGRAPENDWPLDDENCVVSKQHCIIENSDGIYLIRDTSTNGAFLNGGLVGKDSCRSLADGDCVEIGDFAFRIEISGDAPLEEDRVLGSGFQAAVSIPFAGADKSEITGPGLKSLLDDIAARGVTADGIIPGANETMLPATDAKLDIDRKVNAIGWDEAPPVPGLTDAAADTIEDAVGSALEKALLAPPVLPQREDASGFSTVVQFSHAATTLPMNWNEGETSPDIGALTPDARDDRQAEIRLIGSFVRAVNMSEADIGRLETALRSGKLDADQFMAHAGGLFRQSAMALEERLSTVRSKAQALEYTMPAHAVDHVLSALAKAGGDGDDDNRGLCDDLMRPPAAARIPTMLSRMIEKTRILDTAIFTSLLAVTASSPAHLAAHETGPAVKAAS